MTASARASVELTGLSFNHFIVLLRKEKNRLEEKNFEIEYAKEVSGQL